MDRHVVIDNTPYPPNGAMRKKNRFFIVIARANVVLLLHTRTEFINKVSVKSILILGKIKLKLICFRGHGWTYIDIRYWNIRIPNL